MDLSKLYAAAAAAAASNANNNTTSKLIRSHHQLHQQQQQLQPSVVSASNSRLDLESNGASSSLASSSTSSSSSGSGSAASIAGIDLSLAGSGRRATLPLSASSSSAACAALSSFISPVSLAASSASSSTTASSSLSSSTLSLVSAASNPASQHPHHPQLPSHQLIERMLQQYKASAPMTLNGPDWLSFSRPAAAYPQADSNNSSSSAAAATLELINNMMPSGKHRSSSLSDSTPTLDLRVSRQNGSSAGRKAAESYDALLTVPRPFPIQQPPLLTPPDQSACERSETMLENEMIACFTVGGEKRLCFPQILNIVLRDVSLHQINASTKELQIYCSTCTPEQMEVLKRSADIPDTAPSCGLITKTDAHRLCSALLPVQSSPVAGIDFSTISSIVVYHECFGRCVGYYAPSLYRSATSACIQCEECSGLFTPYDFVCHLHRGRENRTVHWGFDPANWRSYILPIEDYHSCNQTTNTTTPITVPGNSQLNPSLNNSHHNSSINCDYRLPVCSGGRKSVKSRLIGTDLERAFFDESIIRIRSTMKEMKTRFATSPAAAAGSASSVSSSKTSAAATTNNNKNNHHHHHHHHHNKRKTMENNCSPSAKDNEIASLQAKSVSTNGGDIGAKLSPALVNQDDSPLSCPASKRLKQNPQSESNAPSNNQHLVNNGSCNTTTNTNSISSSTKATGDYLDPCDLVAPSAASHASLLSALTYPFLQSYLSSSNTSNNGGATIANNLSNHFANWLAGNSAAAAATAAAVSDSQLVNAILKNSSLLTNGGGAGGGSTGPGGVNIEAIAAATKLLASSGNAGIGPMSSLFNGKFSDFGQSAAAQLALAAGAAANPQVFFASINANPSGNITNNNNNSSAPTGINHNNNSTTKNQNSQMPNFQDQQLSALKSEFPMTYENLTKTSLNNESSKLSNSKSLHDSGNKSGNNKNLLFERNNLEVSPPEVGGYFHKNSISTSAAAITTNGVYPHHSHHHPNSRHANLNANSSSQQLQQHGYGPKPFSSNHFSHHTNNLVNGDADCKDNIIINSKLINNNQQNKHLTNNTGYCFQSNFEQRFGLLKNCLSDSKLDSLNRHLSTIESTIDYHQQSNNNHKNLKEIEQYKSKMFQSIFQMIDLFIAPTTDQMAPSSTGANSHNHRTNHHYKFDEDENADDDEQLKMKKEWNDTAEIAKVMRLMKRKIDIDEEEQQQQQKKDVQLLKRNADSRVVCNNIQAKEEIDEEDEDEEIIDVVNNSAKQTNGNEKDEEEAEIDADQHSKHNNNNINKSVILTQKLTKDDEIEDDDDDDEKDIKAIAKKLTMDENGPVMITSSSSSSSSSNQHHTNKQSSSPTLVIVKPQNSQSNCAESSMIVSSSSLSFSSSSARSVSSPSESSLSPSPSPFSSAVASPVSSFDNSQHCSTNHRRHLSKGLSTTESTNPVSISQRSSLSRDSGSNNQNTNNNNIQQSPRLLTTAAGSSPN